MTSQAHLKRIDALRARFHQAAVGKDSLLQLIAETEVAEQVYNSNAIENSTLNLEETEKILQQIDLDRFINERELFEAKNLARVTDYITRNAVTRELTFEVILLLHKMLISHIRDDIAGRFRRSGEHVRVGFHIAPAAEHIPPMLEQMLVRYRAAAEQGIVARIARFHLDFEHLHPFVDGNGRIGRALNNFLLLREGYAPINIRFFDRAQYYDAFKRFDDNGDINGMAEIVGKALSNSFHKRLAYLEGKRIISLSEYAKGGVQSHSNLLNKAKRQTIEAFLERGKWKIGV